MGYVVKTDETDAMLNPVLFHYPDREPLTCSTGYGTMRHPCCNGATNGGFRWLSYRFTERR